MLKESISKHMSDNWYSKYVKNEHTPKNIKKKEGNFITRKVIFILLLQKIEDKDILLNIYMYKKQTKSTSEKYVNLTMQSLYYNASITMAKTEQKEK